MRLFDYIAIDRQGAERKGRRAARDVADLASQLRVEGLAPTAITPALSENTAAGPASPAWRQSMRLPGMAQVRRKDVTVFTRQLSTLLRAGLPLVRSLEVLGKQERNPALKEIIANLGQEIRAGGNLSAGLARQTGCFDPLYVSLVKSGEASGGLTVVLERLARFREQSQRLRSRVLAAMFYPLLVLAVAAGIVGGLLVFVVPKFEQIYADLLKGAPLPPLTQAVMAFSLMIKNHAPLLLAGLILLAAVMQGFRRTTPGRAWLDGLWLRLPMLGEVLVKSVVARFTRTLGTMLSSGVPMLPALLISRDTCGNSQLAEAITGIHQQVKEGAPVAAAMNAVREFPPLVMSLVDVGEHTGALPEMLGRVADIYDEEVEQAVAGLSSLIEPLLILFLALVVGTIVIALFLPIIRIVQLMT